MVTDRCTYAGCLFNVLLLLMFHEVSVNVYTHFGSRFTGCFSFGGHCSLQLYGKADVFTGNGIENIILENKFFP